MTFPKESIMEEECLLSHSLIRFWTGRANRDTRVVIIARPALFSALLVSSKPLPRAQHEEHLRGIVSLSLSESAVSLMPINTSILTDVLSYFPGQTVLLQDLPIEASCSPIARKTILKRSQLAREVQGGRRV